MHPLPRSGSAKGARAAPGSTTRHTASPARALAPLLLLALAASCQSAEQRPRAGAAMGAERQCFFLSQVSGYSHAGRNRIVVSTGPRDRYLFETLGNCPDLDYGEAIAFDPAGPGTICHGIDVDLIVPSSIGPRRCAVGMIRKLLPDERVTR
jgi:hypothetical protein